MLIINCKCGRELRPFKICSTFIGCKESFLCEKCFLKSEECICTSTT